MKTTMKGKGLTRERSKLPPSARNLLNKVGNDKITNIKIIRIPLSSTIKSILNVISLCQFNKIYHKCIMTNYFIYHY